MYRKKLLLTWNTLHLDQLIKGCKQQKAHEQKLLYMQYFGIMMQLCTRYAATTEDAEEMLNNGFLKVFTYIEQYEGKGSFEGWMKRIMSNACLDFLKSKQTKQGKLAYMPNLADGMEQQFLENAMYNNNQYGELEYEQSVTQEELLHHLHGLPHMSKVAFNLNVIEEYTHKEIAVMLGIAERTSQYHVNMAKKLLAEKLLPKTVDNK